MVARVVSSGIEGNVAWVLYPEWTRGKAIVAEGQVILEEWSAERYQLHDVHDALFELGSIRSPQDVKRFVRRHGLLWHGPDSLSAGECAESWADWRNEIQFAAITVSHHMRLREAVASGSTAQLRTFGLRVDGMRDSPDDEEYLREQSYLLSTLVGRHLRRCVERIIPSAAVERGRAADEFAYSSLPMDLLAAAYADFANLVAERAEIIECPGCGRLFHPKSRKQKYHDPACSSTSRGRRWREKQQNK
jgi:hypothetical protein